MTNNCLEIKKIIDSMNAFGENNKLNTKILLGIGFFTVFLLGTKSVVYSITYFVLFIVLSLKPMRLLILDLLKIIEPGLYFLAKKYLPYLSNINGFTQRIYNGIGILFLVLLSYLLIKYVDSLWIVLYYNGVIEKKVLDPFIAWMIFACGYLMIGNLKIFFYLIQNFILSWTFLASSMLIIILLKIENSDYFNTLIIYFPLLLAIIVQYKLFDTEISNKTYAQYKLYFNEANGKWKEYLSFIRNQSEETFGNISAISDSPISYRSEDIFGYKNIADNAYNLIKGINADNGSYSIGIIGEWGLGKSSIIGMLKESKLKLDSNIILHEFNPWNYTKSDLINNFITEIATKVNKRDLTKLLIKYTELLSGINSTAGAIIKLVKSLFGNEKTIDEIREQIGEELGKTNKKLVVIIDDLDRCEPEEIITMLNVVKNIGNFSHVIYLISFDKLHIIKALNTKGFHEDYIEKIINTEIHVPLPDKETKANYFSQKFTELLGEVGFGEDWIKESCENIINTGTSGLDEIFEKENLRLIKKLLNKLNVNFKLVYNSNNKRCELLSKEDIANIVLINYIKIKHLDFYNDVIKKRNMMSPDTFFYKTPNRPPMYLNMKERRLEQLFLDNIAGLNIAIGENDTLQIFNQNTLKSVPDLAHRIDYLNKNWGLLREFS